MANLLHSQLDRGMEAAATQAGMKAALPCNPAALSLTLPASLNGAGLERFKFEDATAGEEDGNTTGGFSNPP